MKIIEVHFRNRAELLVRYEGALEHGGIFIPTRQPMIRGESVILDIRMPKLHDSLMLRGQVVWSRHSRRGSGQPAGMIVEFLPSEIEKRDYLLSLARDHTHAKAGSRRHKRLPLHLHGDWHLVANKNRRHSCLVSDIGSGGAFLQTSTLLPNGTPVVLEVNMPGSAMQQAIEGRVAWSRDTPGDAGFGIEFRCRDMAGKRRIRELVRRLRESMAS